MNPQMELKKAEQAVTRALTEALPSHWTRADLNLRLEVFPDGRVRQHVGIASPEGNSEKITPPHSFFSAVDGLVATVFRQGKRPKSIAFHLEKATDATWGARVKYVS